MSSLLLLYVSLENVQYIIVFKGTRISFPIKLYYYYIIHFMVEATVPFQHNVPLLVLQ